LSVMDVNVEDDIYTIPINWLRNISVFCW
jgi:hypothetical protein